MKSTQRMVVCLFVLTILLAAATAWAGYPGWTARPTPWNPNVYAWHGNYYYTAWGRPVALVVPPTADTQTHWGWGVGNTQTSRIWNQFGPNYPGASAYDGRGLKPTPPWPGSTDQFGVYYVRGPW